MQPGGYAAWIANQLTLPASHLLPSVQGQAALLINNQYTSSLVENAWWQAAITAPDQLRQRMAFALSEILVVSDSNSTLAGQANAFASYYDMLADNAFGNFRDLLKAATLHPTMGYWLNMQGNSKGNLATGYHPNENYAREVMQLFSIGLNRLWPDGSTVLDSQGNLVPTYDQGVITNGFARVFTGWTWNQALQSSGQLPTNFYPATDWTDPMVMVKNFHELGSKTLLDNVVLPPAIGYSPTTAAISGSQADTTTTAYDAYCLQDLEQGLDSIFYHPNVGPYVCRQLIQRLVESNPSPAYLYRVVQVFNDDGTTAHVRGNLAAVIKAILLDGEARDANAAGASTTFGKQREPLLRITGPARTFLWTANAGTYTQSGALTMTVTTNAPHRLSAGDVIGLDFTVNDTGTPPVAPTNNPTSGSYSVLSNPAPTATTFAVNASSLTSVAFTQAAGTNTVTVNTGGPDVGEKVYLKFLSGGTDGIYTVASIPDSTHFTVTTTGTAPSAAVTGTVIVPKVGAIYTVTNPKGATVSTVTLATTANSNLAVGDHVQLLSSGANYLPDTEFVVASVPNERYLTLTATQLYTAEFTKGCTLFALVHPPLSRSGNVALSASKFDMGNTNSQIVQTPLDSPTVFNYFYPDY